MLEAGKQFGRYRICSGLGTGGMGEVFLADDARLNRKVALKVLPETLAADSERLRRFEQEAKAASALNHPNILTIFEFGAAGGTHFLAAEYIKGVTLRERIKQGDLTLQETLDITAQIASALQAAHASGIIHRDIKPENVMIRADGYVKVLDFGLAKLLENAPLDEEAETRMRVQTEAGMVMGTAAYMSPEQARGKRVDARTDIFSLGVVLYEMLARRQPFTGETINHTIVAILEKEPSPLSHFISGYPAEIERIIEKCLAKKADERYQSSKNLLDDLKELKEELVFQSKLERSASPDKSAESPTQIIKAAATGETETQTNSIAVLPFTNMSADKENEYFCDGLAEELLNALAKIDDLRVAARTSAFSFKNKNVEVSQIGKTLNVKTILEGSVRKSRNELRITVQLVNAADGFQLWSERYDREMQDIFNVQDEITLAVVDALKVKLFGEEKADVLKRYTDNTEAYELFLKGRYHYNKYSPEGWQKGVEYFQKAIENDSNYAPAFAGTAQCRFMLWFFGVLPADEIIPEARAATDRALKIDERLSEAHLSLAHIHCYYDWNWEEAERGYSRAVELSPNSADAHAWRGMFLVLMERFAEAFKEGKQAIELDPLSLFLNSHVGWLYFFADRLDEALEQDRKMLEIEPNFDGAYWQMGVVYSVRGKHREAIEALEKSMTLGGNQIALSNLGRAYALAGKTDEALKVLNQLLETRERQHAAAFNIARVYAGLGDRDKELEWLEKACEERNGEAVLLDRQSKVGAGDFWGKNIRRDSRFQKILRRIGALTEEQAEVKTEIETSEAQTAIFLPVKTDAPKEAPAIVTDNKQPSSPEKTKAKRKWWIFGLLAFVLLASAFFAYRYFTPTSKQIESIAVLPFENASGNADIEYLSDGMTETLIGSLSQLPNLNVKARTSVFRYKGKEIDPKLVGQELTVQAILTGRVVQRGQNLTLYVELIDAQTENVLWKADYKRQMTNLVSLQSEIARDVSQKLKTKLSGIDEQRLTKNYTENAEAYRLYLQGRFYWNKRTIKDTRKSIEYFEQAIAVDPNYALGYAGLADGYALLSNLGGAPPHESMPKAKEAAQKALSLDGNLGEAHATLGLILTNYDYDFAAAEREYLRAIELNPNYAMSHFYYGQLLSQLSRHEEGLVSYRRALEIEPFSLIINVFYGSGLLNARRFDEAIAQLKKTLELDPNFAIAHSTLSGIYQAKGNYAESVEEFAKFQELVGNSQVAAAGRDIFAREGWHVFLRKMSAEEQIYRNDGRYRIIFLTALGEKDKAIEALNNEYEKRRYFITLLKVSPLLDALRDDPRFEELLRKVRFPE